MDTAHTAENRDIFSTISAVAYDFMALSVDDVMDGKAAELLQVLHEFRQSERDTHAASLCAELMFEVAPCTRLAE